MRDARLRGAGPRPRWRGRGRPRLRHLPDSMDAVPALVIGRRNDVLAWNRLGHALPAGTWNSAARTGWRTGRAVADAVPRPAHPRALSAVDRRGARARRLPAADRELPMKSPEFAELWGRRRVHDCTYGCKQLRHPLVGPLPG
ncbi:hypothetical protein [Saccharopolyspora sp. NPDC050642]|uniref:MmyB family transcriptional regulator n=1 Tax=Saccharopolyspora sp. NPDC050642 TaxID=3157099 RepID=UPI0033CB73A0